jgi:ribonuclease G
VQVCKEAIGTKGARVTTYISLPGKYVVLMPDIDHLGVSRRIENEAERERLKTILEEIRPQDVGIIARTASENAKKEKIRAEVEFLYGAWNKIKEAQKPLSSPALVHEDLDLIFRTTRDLISLDLDKIIIDNQKKYKTLVSFLEGFNKQLASHVEYYNSSVQIFDAYGIENEIARALNPKVWLKSGGYLIIEQTEALTAIDVNTGKFVGGRDLEDTIIKTNREAIVEIVHQIRLRNIGGIIIIDFIDMEKREDREWLYEELLNELKKDKAKTSVIKFSEIGLVQMTRKRTEQSLLHKLTVNCGFCEGRGRVKSPMTVTYDILRELQRDLTIHRVKKLKIKAHHSIIDRLCEEDSIFLEHISSQYACQISLHSVENCHIEFFEIIPFLS